MKLLARILIAWVVSFALPNAEAAGVVDAKNYMSPAGHYVLGIDPGDRTGAGPANYHLRKDGRTVWSGQRPFTLANALVTDEGIVGGYAYSDGNESAAGEFIVVVVDVKGRTRLMERKARKESPYLHADPDPKGIGLILVDSRMVVRVSDPEVNDQSDMWWIYRLGTARSETKIQPQASIADAQRLGRMVDARPVNGTPLVLVQWLLHNETTAGTAQGYGARFALLDRSGAAVWSTDFENDYSMDLDERAQAKLLTGIIQSGAILNTTIRARFEVRKVATHERLGFAVEPVATKRNGWSVRLVDRRAYASAEPRKPEIDDVRPLRMLGSITLQTDAETNPSPIRDVQDFAVGDNAFAFVTGCRCDRSQPRALVVVDGEGRLVRSVPLPIAPGSGTITDHVAWGGGHRWLVATSTSAEGGHSSTAWVDDASGALTPIAAFNAPGIEALVTTEDGGFLILAKEQKAYSSKDTLRSFDVNGRLRWSLEEGQSDGTDLFSPKDMAVFGSGKIVVLENIVHQLKIHAPDGGFLRSIDLAAAWGRKPNYPVAIAVDGEDHVIVHDFHGKPSIIRMSLDGKVSRSFDPAYADGRRFDLRRTVKAAVDGRMWTSDGDALLRLDQNGTVDRILGTRHDANTLGRVAAFAVTAKGASYAVDDRTGVVHAFDMSGMRTRVFRPAIDDYDGRLWLPVLAIADSGDVYVSRDRRGDAGLSYIHYSADGSRIGLESLAVDSITQTWIAQPGTSRRWVLGYDGIHLVDASGVVIRHIERDSEGRWLTQPRPAAAAPDGSLAVLFGGPIRQFIDGRSSSGYGTLALYSANGDPLRSWPAPAGALPMPGAIAYDGRRLAFVVGADVGTGAAIAITDRSGTVISRFTPDAIHPPQRVYFVDAGDSQELWVFDGKVTVTRYAMP